MSSLFVDTSGWASFFIHSQTYYPQTEQYFRLALQQKQKIYTTNYVIAELVALLNSPLQISRSRVFEIVDAIKSVNYVEVVHIDEATDALAWTLCKSRRDKA